MLTLQLANPSPTCFIVCVPELGLEAIIRGDTPEEAMERMRAVLQLLMDKAKAVCFIG